MIARQNEKAITQNKAKYREEKETDN